MNDQQSDVFWLILLAIVSIFLGIQAFHAWLRPQEHRRFIDQQDSLFRGLPFNENNAWISNYKFWASRVSFTVVFLASLCITIYLLIQLLR